MKKKYDFLFPDGYTYTISLNLESTISTVIDDMRGAIFKEDKEQFDGSVQNIKIFYSGVFLNNEFKFSEIKYSEDVPLKVYIKPTPEALKAKSEHYKDLLNIGYIRKPYTQDQKDELICKEDSKILSEVDTSVLKKLKAIKPQNMTDEIMILFCLCANNNVIINDDIRDVEEYFANIHT